MADEPKKNLNFIWKFIAILVIGILIGIFLAKYVHAQANWPLNQSDTCNLPSINKTGIYCDAYWCENFVSNSSQNCTYNILSSQCNCLILNLTLPGTNSTNQTIQNQSNYYNRTEVDNLLGLNQTNSTNQTVIQYCSNYTDIKLRELRDSQASQFEQLRQETNSRIQSIQIPNGAQTPWWLIGLIVVVIGGVIAYLAWIKKNSKKEFDEREKPVLPKMRQIAEENKDE